MNKVRIELHPLSTTATINALKESGILWARYKSGVWNDYSDILPIDEVIEKIKNSPYGADAYLVYDGEPKEDDENLLYAECSMPSASDMY